MMNYFSSFFRNPFEGRPSEEDRGMEALSIPSLVGDSGLGLFKRLPIPERGTSSDFDLDSLLSNSHAEYAWKGSDFEVFLENETEIRAFIKFMPALLEQKIATATKISHVAQLGGVRGVPGAVGAAGGLATGIALLLRGEMPSEVIDLTLKIIQSAGVGLLVMEVGYRVAGSLGKRKERDLASDMKKIAYENARKELAIELRNLILDNIRIRPKESCDVVVLDAFKRKAA